MKLGDPLLTSRYFCNGGGRNCLIAAAVEEGVTVSVCDWVVLVVELSQPSCSPQEENH